MNRIIALLAALAFAGCAESSGKIEPQEKPEFWSYYSGDAFIFVDQKTGVNYFRPTGTSTSITPRLNPDGTLFITK